jgi:hypothetical protein
MYVFKYLRKDNGELLGYHLDTAGQLGPKEHAKRYGSEIDTEESRKSQTETIVENLQSRLNPKEGGWFYEFYTELKATSYQGLNFDQVEVVLEEVEHEEIILKAHTLVHGDGTIEKL